MDKLLVTGRGFEPDDKVYICPKPASEIIRLDSAY